MKKQNFLLVGLVCVGVLVVGFVVMRKPHKGLRVGVVIPVEHPALRQIVKRFSQTLQTNLPNQVEIEVQNAQGDTDTQSSLIRNFLNQPVDLLVTVSTRTTQQAIQQASGAQPILFLSAEVASLKMASSERLVAGVNDDLDLTQQVMMLKQTIPNLKKVSVVYSQSEKIFPEIDRLQSLLALQHVALQKLGVTLQSDVAQVCHLIDADTDAIFVLKDVLVTNAIQPLVQTAKQLHKPLVTSDESTVYAGAAFALGVREADIGKQGGKLAANLLRNKQQLRNQNNYKIESVQPVMVFVNEKACVQQGVDPEHLRAAAAQQHAQVVAPTAFLDAP